MVAKAPAAAAERGVDEIAEGEGEAEDRSQVRAARVAQASLWERLLDDFDGPPANISGKSFEVAGGAVADPSAPRSGAHRARTELLEAQKVGGQEEAPVRRGMIRFLYILVDMTDAARQPDYKPRRHEFAVEAAKRFARRFLAENPLAEIGLVVLRAGSAEMRMTLGSSAEEFCERLDVVAADGPRGRMSIASGLQRVLSGLEDTPPYGTREVIVLFASLSTFDAPEMPLGTLTTLLSQHRVRVSVVSMSAELYALRRISKETDGDFGVALDHGHFEDLFEGHLSAPVCTNHTVVPRLVRMGFPRQVIEAAVPAACACHLQPQARLHVCPQCETRVCRVPGRCPGCELPLASSPLLARTFRQLLPPPAFAPSENLAAAVEASGSTERRCCGCDATLFSANATEDAWHCPECGNDFCEPCDAYIHGSLRQCPGCLEASRASPAPPAPL